MFRMMAIANDVKRILSLLGRFSQELLDKIAANGYVRFNGIGNADNLGGSSSEIDV